ncbi:MAG: hypothetical protein ACLFO2_03970 [Candidatus Woesearchaeota archaeon]
MVGVSEQAFLVDSRWIERSLELAGPAREDVVFLLGGGNGQVASALGEGVSRVVTVEPDQAIANYLYSLELYRNLVVQAPPHLVLGDMGFDKLLCLQPSMVDESVLEGMLSVPFSRAVLMMSDDVAGAFRRRDMLGTLLRAAFDHEVVRSVPKNAFSPALPFPASLVVVSPASDSDPVKRSLRLLLSEAGTMRGLLTRSCREFFGYTLAEAQEAVKLLDKDLLRKRFSEVSEEEFQQVYEWLKLG